jgi:hypothetical protein
MLCKTVIYKIVTKLSSAGSVLVKKKSRKRRVLTEEELDISVELEAALKKLCLLAVQCRLAKNRVMLVKLRPHKTIVARR